jgi:tol-pal system protein YbgF
VKTASKPPSSDAEGLYDWAFQLFRGGKFEAARAEFSSYLERYPKTDLADNAQFWLGECYYSEKSYRQAIGAYEKTIKDYPKSDKVSSALLKQGMAFLEMGDKTAGKILLKKVVKGYPQSNQAKIARSKLARIK